jgi:endonuclease/exonuclease/phosphatase family metal-dependent hydrolase
MKRFMRYGRLFFIPVLLLATLQGQPAGAVSSVFTPQGSGIHVGDWAIYEPVENLSMDVDGNGLRDLVRVFKSPNGNGKALVDVLFSNGSAFYRNGSADPLDIGGWSEGGARVRNVPIDMNGDGKEDLVRIWRASTGKAMTDVLFSVGGGFARPGNPVVQEVGDWSLADEPKFMAMYVNDDTKADLVSVYKSAVGKAMVYVLFSNGTVFYQPNEVQPTDVGDWELQNELVQMVVMDVNGDKREDLVRIGKDAAGKAITDILFSAGNGFYRPANPALLDVGDWFVRGENVQNFAMDIDTDGKVDLVRIFRTAEGQRAADILYSSGTSFYRPTAAISISPDVAPGDADSVLLNASKPLSGKASFFNLQNVSGQAYARIITAEKNYTYDASDRLTAGHTLEQGHYIRSANGQYKLIVHENGDLVLLNIAGQTLWHTNTPGSGATVLAMQGDGNLVLYRDGSPVWDTDTATYSTAIYPALALIVKDDGNVALETSANTPIWQTKYATPPNADPVVSVMAYNIRENTSPEDLSAVAQTIHTKNPDIVLLNEVNVNSPIHPAQHLALFGGYMYWHYESTTSLGFTGTKGVAILSRYPLLQTQYHPVPGSFECFASLFTLDPCPTFGILQASIQIRGVQHEIFSLRFAPLKQPGQSGFHWSLEQNNRNGHALIKELVGNVPASHPVIVGGDFNADWSRPWSVSLRDTIDMKDALVEFERQYGGKREWRTRADYIYYRVPYVLNRAESKCGYPGVCDPIAHGYASDHPYVFAAFGASEPAATTGGGSMNY